MTVLDEKGGVLILIAGPSGAGKDTLIAAGRQAFARNPEFVFPLRFISRAEQAGEEHIYLSPPSFEGHRLERRLYLEWEAHGHHYGIPVSVEDDLRAGRAVVFNISRQLIPAACQKWPWTEVIVITAAPEVLRHRLRKRGRETEDQIEARLKRGNSDLLEASRPVHVFDNSGPLHTAIPQFLTLLSTLKQG
jgi:phosphonate metabolism protein PhnN/1,5-bisphosphokinase (PRPP-forming)